MKIKTSFLKSTSATMAVLWLCLSPGSLRAGLNIFTTDDFNVRNTDPQAPPWQNASGNVITVNPGQVIWLGCDNIVRDYEDKHWILTLTSQGAPEDVSAASLTPGVPDGFMADGSKARIGAGLSNPDESDGVRTIQFNFKPQPLWERISLKNNTQNPISFTATANSSCDYWLVNTNSLIVPEFDIDVGSSNAMQTNEDITYVVVLPQNEPVDPSTPETVSAPESSGFWYPSLVYEDPLGNPAPLGGVVYATGGPGIANGQSMGFTLGTMGPGADTQYIVYTWDEVSQQWLPPITWNLAPSLYINLTNVSGTDEVDVTSDSIKGLNYTLQSSSDLNTWQPIQTWSGSSYQISRFFDVFVDIEVPAPAEFFQVQAQPSPPVIVAPTVNGISATVGSSDLNIHFNELVDPSTALDPNNYFLSGPSGLAIENIVPKDPWDIQLVLNLPLTTGKTYGLEVSGVANPSGQVMSPIAIPFFASPLQTPCPGGTLLARQTYSVCNSDGYWHVVEDDWYDCPGASKPESFRVADTKTTQPCNSSATPPNPVGLIYVTDADVVQTCQSFNTIGPLNVCTCSGSAWSASSYMQYQCQDGTLYVSGPIQTVPMSPSTACDAKPPLSPAPQ